MDSERRCFIRVPFRSEAALKSPEGQFRGTVENLSINGAFFKMTDKIPVGTAVEVEIFLAEPASDISFVIGGTVIRHTPDGLGIGFSGMYLGDFERLRDAIATSIGDKKRVIREFLKFMER